MARYGGDARPRGFFCWVQYLGMAFAQLTYQDSLRDIEVWDLNVSLYQILQILSVRLFEKTPISPALQPSASEKLYHVSAKQLSRVEL